MRRIRREATKVWHNPEITTTRRGSGSGEAKAAAPTAEDRREQSKHRAALEALFAPKRDSDPGEDSKRPSAPGGVKSSQRIVLPPPPASDPRTAERQKLLGKFLHAEGRPAVSKAANDFLRAGFTFPDDQDIHLKLLEHADEEHVRCAIDSLTTLLAGELPKRRAVLESRLRRIEQFAEEAPTREAAERLRRRVSGSPS